MKKAILLVALFALSMQFTNCTKPAPDEEPNPVVNQPTKTDLISREWTMTEIKYNGEPMNGNTQYYFGKNGDFKAAKDPNGNWKYSGKWQFTSDETGVKVFAGQTNEQYWHILSLSETLFEAEYMPTTADRFTFKLAAN